MRNVDTFRAIKLGPLTLTRFGRTGWALKTRGARRPKYPRRPDLGTYRIAPWFDFQADGAGYMRLMVARRCVFIRGGV